MITRDQHGVVIWSVARHSTLLIVLWTLIVGVPTHFILRRASWTRWYVYTGSGLLLGGVSMTLLMSFSFYGLSTSIDEFSRKLPMVPGMFLAAAPILGPMGGLCGAITALVFWMVARPDLATVGRSG